MVLLALARYVHKTALDLQLLFLLGMLQLPLLLVLLLMPF
jgi:hypothetical protein